MVIRSVSITLLQLHCIFFVTDVNLCAWILYISVKHYRAAVVSINCFFLAWLVMYSTALQRLDCVCNIIITRDQTSSYVSFDDDNFDVSNPSSTKLSYHFLNAKHTRCCANRHRARSRYGISRTVYLAHLYGRNIIIRLSVTAVTQALRRRPVRTAEPGYRVVWPAVMAAGPCVCGDGISFVLSFHDDGRARR